MKVIPCINLEVWQTKYYSKKAASTTTRVKNQLQRTVLLLTTPHHPINFVLEKKRKRKNETKYFLLEFIVIAIPNRLLYFSFNSQCASAFFPEWKSLNHTHCSITLQFFTPYILHLQNTYFSKVLAQKTTKALSVEPEQWKDTPSTCIHTYYTVVTP